MLQLTTCYRAMEFAPRDGRTMTVRTRFGDVRAYYVDCEWLREGDLAESVTDCWRPVEPDNPFGDNDIEFKEALGWRPNEGGWT